MLEIKTNISKFISTEIKHYNKAVRDATRSATLKVAKSARTNASKDIREEYRIKKSDLDKHITVSKPDANMMVRIYVRKGKESLPVYKFGKPTQTKSGVTVRIKKGKSERIKSAFIATMPTGHKGVFMFGPQRESLPGEKPRSRRKASPRYERRTGNKGKYITRLPIDELMSRAAAHIVTKKIYNKLKIFVAQKYDSVFKHELQFRLRR